MTVLSEAESARLLESYGIPVAAWRLAQSPEEAAEAAGELGFPVVLKASFPGLAHKSDVGGVRLDLRTPEEVRAAAQEMAVAVGEKLGAGQAGSAGPVGAGQAGSAGPVGPGAGAAGAAARAGTPPRLAFFLQKMVTGGLEMIAGGSRDPQFGPAVMCGLGGIYTEAFKDVAFVLAPCDEAAASRAVARTRSSRLLGGLRGQAPRDEAALARVMVSLGKLMAERPEVKSVDVNPLMVLAKGQGCVAVDALVEVAD